MARGFEMELYERTIRPVAGACQFEQGTLSDISILLMDSGGSERHLWGQ
jgi:hypothetical protein